MNFYSSLSPISLTSEKDNPYDTPCVSCSPFQSAKEGIGRASRWGRATCKFLWLGQWHGGATIIYINQGVGLAYDVITFLSCHALGIEQIKASSIKYTVDTVALGAFQSFFRSIDDTSSSISDAVVELLWRQTDAGDFCQSVQSLHWCYRSFISTSI